MIKIEHDFIRDQIHINEILCCDCYFDLCFYLLRRKSNFDEIHNTFDNLSNCYYAIVCNMMILSCYKMLIFVFDNNRDKFYRNCFKTFLKINNSRLRLCILCIKDFFFFLSGRMNELSLCVCDE